MTDPTTATLAAALLDAQPAAAVDLAAEVRTGPVGAAELAAHLAARMCHDYISPAGAIISGLDLLEDPSAQDMREEAMGLIASSAKKLVDHLSFDRVALGASAAAETFDTRALETLAQGVFAHGRASLTWSVEPRALPKPAARALLNLAQIGLGALPTGGVATVQTTDEDGFVSLEVECKGARARLRPAVIDGLEGRRLGEGLPGLWVQAYYLRQIVDSAGGGLDYDVSEERVAVRVRMPD
ncbi:MAG: histidine phosphotransferase [Caulobacteraceae bacterium]|nr:histidine phosphotransferase [Caulobacteraceae bacterium]